MRNSVWIGLAGSLALFGCTSSTGVDSVMDLPPSMETTASIPKPSVPLGDNELEAGSAPSGLAALNAVLPSAQAPDPIRVATAPIAKPEISAPKPRVRKAGLFSGSRNAFSDLTVYRQRFRDAKPVDFGRASPRPFEVHGVDVSHWQGDIDWKKLRTQGANFAFIKATEGGKHADRLFKTNWKNAKAAGIPTGAYHFMYWCRHAKEQAEWFIRNVPKEKGSLPPVLDVEWNGNKRTCPGKLPRKTVLKKMQVWMDIVERHYGVKPVIYVTPDFYEDNLKGQFKEYSFWLRSVAQHPKGRYPNRDFAFWQYSGTGLSKGVSTQIDLNVFNGTEESWKRWLSQRVM
ncbi:MAG: GH25 family lysozyme [Pseudomonadota bacterium]